MKNIQGAYSEAGHKSGMKLFEGMIDGYRPLTTVFP